jgi:hypothetical protein
MAQSIAYDPRISIKERFFWDRSWTVQRGSEVQIPYISHINWILLTFTSGGHQFSNIIILVWLLKTTNGEYIAGEKFFWTLLELREAIRREAFQVHPKHIYVHKN